MDAQEKVFFRKEHSHMSGPFTSAEAAFGTDQVVTISEYHLVSTKTLRKRVLIEEEPEAPTPPEPPPDMPF